MSDILIISFGKSQSLYELSLCTLNQYPDSFLNGCRDLGCNSINLTDIITFDDFCRVVKYLTGDMVIYETNSQVRNFIVKYIFDVKITFYELLLSTYDPISCCAIDFFYLPKLLYNTYLFYYVKQQYKRFELFMDSDAVFISESFQQYMKLQEILINNRYIIPVTLIIINNKMCISIFDTIPLSMVQLSTYRPLCSYAITRTTYLSIHNKEFTSRSENILSIFKANNCSHSEDFSEYQNLLSDSYDEYTICVVNFLIDFFKHIGDKSSNGFKKRFRNMTQCYDQGKMINWVKLFPHPFCKNLVAVIDGIIDTIVDFVDNTDFILDPVSHIFLNLESQKMLYSKKLKFCC